MWQHYSVREAGGSLVWDDNAEYDSPEDFENDGLEYWKRLIDEPDLVVYSWTEPMKPYFYVLNIFVRKEE